MTTNGTRPQTVIIPAKDDHNRKIGLDDYLLASEDSVPTGPGKLLELTKNGEHPLLGPDMNDVGNANRLIEFCGKEIRYLPAFKRWVLHNGVHWPVDNRENDDVRARAHDMLRAYALQAAAADKQGKQGAKEHGQFAFSCLNTSRVDHLLREAQPYASLTVSELDRDPLLVNFRNGTLDARTMQLRPHRREDYITALISHDYKPKARCPRFDRFIQQTFAGDRQAIDFVKRALGYSLTGDTSAKSIFLAHGPTDTGKTTLLTAIRKLLGNYAGLISVESLMVERWRAMDSNAKADLADLRGKRFVNTSETGQGQRLREELIKLLAQGQGEFKAVRKYENPIKFAETWKLWLDCNHLPVVHGTDDAIWNRLIVVPFQHSLPKAKQNPKLGDQLIEEEAEGILAWLVQGLACWKSDGLRLPPSMQQRQQEWRNESDDFGLWIAEKCVCKQGDKSKSETLRTSYNSWRMANNFPMQISSVVFARKMKERGFVKKEEGHDKVPHWLGIALKKRKHE